MAETKDQAGDLVSGASSVPRWVVEEDVYEELPDGRVVQHAHKGAGLPYGAAHELGLAKGAYAPMLDTKAADRERFHVGKPPVSRTAKAGAVAPAGAERMAELPAGAHASPTVSPAPPVKDADADKPGAPEKK